MDEDTTWAGTYTFLLTDIENSAQRWEQRPQAMNTALARHDLLLRQSIEQQQGTLFKSLGDGNFAVFAEPLAAVQAALSFQSALVRAQGDGVGLRVRVALATGSATARDGDYFGPAINRAARLLQAAHGGQTLLALSTWEAVAERLPPGIGVRNLGERRLKGLTGQEAILQLLIPGAPSFFPPLRTLEPCPSHLPAPITPLLGRDQELQALLARLCPPIRTTDAASPPPATRLLTLLGSGGIGKTRLALEAAHMLRDDFADGVWFVPLAPVRTPARVMATVSALLGMSEEQGTSLAASLLRFLHERHLLLVLDNFEQVSRAAPLISEWLAAAPRLHILTTSRRALKLYGEQTFPVPPLPTPPRPRARRASPRPLVPEQIAAYPSIALFVARAQAVDPTFVLNADNSASIAMLCARLDGLPLAIELAAARIRHFSPQALVQSLADTLSLLASRTRDRTPRQRSLQGALDWSHDLLSSEEQRLFALLGLFLADSSIEAVEAVWAATAPFTTAPEFVVSAGLAELESHSLLSLREADGVPSRIHLLETIRHYAAERLEQLGGGTVEQAWRGLAQYLVMLVERAEPELTGPEQGQWFARLDSEHETLRGTLQWLMEHGEVALALRMVGVLWRFWATRSYLTEGAEWMENVLARADGLPAADRAAAHQGAGQLVLLKGELVRARQHLEASHALYGTLDDHQAQAWVLSSLGRLLLRQGDEAAALRVLEESLRLHRAAGEAAGSARALHELGVLHLKRGDAARAVTFFEEALAERRILGSPEGIALSLSGLGDALRVLGEYARATLHYEESLVLYRTLGYPAGVAGSLHNLAYALLHQGERQRPLEHFYEALSYLQSEEEPLLIASCLAGLASALTGVDEGERAAHLFGAAAAMLGELGIELDEVDRQEYERSAQVVRGVLGDSLWERYWSAGYAFSMGEALLYAEATRLTDGSTPNQNAAP